MDRHYSKKRMIEAINLPASKLRQNVLRSALDIDDLNPEAYCFRLASSTNDYFDAFKLVQDTYVHGEPPNSGRAFDNTALLQNLFFDKKVVFIGKHWSSAIFTASLFTDSFYGLPMDSVFETDLDRIRSMGRVVAEIGCLAFDPEFTELTRSVPMHAVKTVLIYAKDYLKVDDIVIAIHPSQAMVYEDILLFEPVGRADCFPNNNNEPAVAMRLNLNYVQEKYESCYKCKPRRKNLFRFLFERNSRCLNLPEKKLNIYKTGTPVYSDYAQSGAAPFELTSAVVN